MTNFSFGRTERGNNNIPELSLESAGIKRMTDVFEEPPMPPKKPERHGDSNQVGKFFPQCLTF